MGFKPKKRAPAGYRFNRKRLYKAISNRRDKEGISWREIGRQSNTREMTLLRLARGQGPTMENYGKLCAWLGVEVAEFFE